MSGNRKEAAGGAEGARDPIRFAELLRTAVVVTAALLFLCGVAYPLLLFGVGRLAFPRQAAGSLVRDGDGRIVGSALIGQSFTELRYFHGRPSAAGYDAANSSGSNLGPTNPKLLIGARGTAEAYRSENALGAGAAIPIDAVTASASGLDPHISPANAMLQVPRVAHARGARVTAVQALVESHTEGRQLAVLGESRVNVLLLNLALDSLLRAEGKP
jgi:potassium-transporting ATPase KdpC subunit